MALSLLLNTPLSGSSQHSLVQATASSVYGRWHSKQGGVSPLCKEVRASWTLTKVLGWVHCQESEGVEHAPSPAVSKGSVGLGGHETPSLNHAAMPEVSSHIAAGDQALPSPWPLTTARKPAANLNPPTRRRMVPMKMSMQMPVRVKLRY